MFHRIKDATPIINYQILVHFFDGENKLYNMKPLLQKNIFSPLKDISLLMG